MKKVEYKMQGLITAIDDLRAKKVNGKSVKQIKVKKGAKKQSKKLVKRK